MFENNIYNNLNANLPYTLIHTTELNRANLKMIRIAKKYITEFFEGGRIFLWRYGTGWIQIPIDSQVFGWKEQQDFLYTQDRDYIAALNRIENGELENSILLLNNFGYAFSLSNLVPILIEKFTNLYDICKTSDINCFFIGKPQPIPVEINPLFASVTLPLPNEKELCLLIYKILKSEQLRLSEKKLRTISKKMSLILKGLTEKEVERTIYTSISKKNLTYSAIYEIKKELVKKSGFLEIIDIENALNLGGLNNFKEYYKKVSLYYKDTEQAKKLKIPPPKGCCLVGIQGCGKSLSAKTLARLFGLPLYRWDIGSMLGKFVGQSEENTRKALDLITSVSPCVVLIDEAEKLFSGYGTESSGVIGRVLGDILYYMEEKNKGTFFIFTTNSIDNLPPELLRAGRLDTIWFVDLPNQKERKEIFKIHLKEIGFNPSDQELEEYSNLSFDFSGADIKNAIQQAQYEAFYANKKLSHIHILSSIKQTIPFGKTNKMYVEQLRTWARNKTLPAN